MAKPSSKGLTAIDLFAGCGGLSVGLRQAGFHVLAALEIDSLAAETYLANHREAAVLQQDIRKSDPAQIRKSLGLKKGQLDLLAGCPPCQGFSSMRTLNGSRAIRDPQNDLIFDFLRFVEEFMPKSVMMENVPGLATDRRLKQFTAALTRLGYSVNHAVLDTANFNVPQKRKRLILLAGHNRGNIAFAKQVKEHSTVRKAIGHLPRPGQSGDPLHDITVKRAPEVLEIISMIPKNGGSRDSLPPSLRLKCHKKPGMGFRDVYGRMAWDLPAPTITGGCINPSKGRFLHPRQNRAITLREAALLQTFPRNYKFSLRRGKYPAAQMIGNALPPEFIRRHALAVKSYLLSL